MKTISTALASLALTGMVIASPVKSDKACKSDLVGAIVQCAMTCLSSNCDMGGIAVWPPFNRVTCECDCTKSKPPPPKPREIEV